MFKCVQNPAKMSDVQDILGMEGEKKTKAQIEKEKADKALSSLVSPKPSKLGGKATPKKKCVSAPVVSDRLRAGK